MYIHRRMKGVRMSNIQLYIIIVRCEQRDGPLRPSAHHVTGRLKKISADAFIAWDRMIV